MVWCLRTAGSGASRRHDAVASFAWSRCIRRRAKAVLILKRMTSGAGLRYTRTLAFARRLLVREVVV